MGVEVEVSGFEYGIDLLMRYTWKVRRLGIRDRILRPNVFNVFCVMPVFRRDT